MKSLNDWPTDIAATLDTTTQPILSDGDPHTNATKKQRGGNRQQQPGVQVSHDQAGRTAVPAGLTSDAVGTMETICCCRSPKRITS